MRNLNFATFMLVLVGSIVGTMRAQSPSDISVEGARPLNEALFVINDRFNQSVIYEEIHYEAKKYLQTGERIGLLPDRNYPKGGILDIHLVNNEQDGYNALRTMMAAYKAQDPSLDYSTTISQEVFCILPKEMEDTRGQVKHLRPVLNTLISIPSTQRNIRDAIQLFATTLAKRSGEKIIVLVQPYREEEVTWGADNESAVDTLVRLAKEIGPVTIRLLFDPSDSTYYLSFTPLSSNLITQPIRKEANKAPLTASPFFVKDKTVK